MAEFILFDPNLLSTPHKSRNSRYIFTSFGMETYEVTATVKDGKFISTWHGAGSEDLPDDRVFHVSRTLRNVARRFPVSVRVEIGERCDQQSYADITVFHVETVGWKRYVHVVKKDYAIVIDMREINGETWCSLWNHMQW